MESSQPQERYSGLIKTCAILVIIALLLLAIHLAVDIIAPVVISVFVAVLLRPSVRFLNETLRLPLSVAAFLAVLYAVILVAFVIGMAGYQLGNLMENSAVMADNLEKHLTFFQKWIRRVFGLSYSKQYQYLRESMAGQAEEAMVYFSSLANGLLYIVLIPLYTFFILFYRSLLLTFLVKLSPNSYIPGIEKVLTGIQSIIKNYIRGIILQAIFVSALMAAGYYTIGLKYSLFLGIFTGLLNFIPYVGILTACLVCSVIALGQSQDSTILFWVLGVNGLVQLIDNNIIVPKIVGSKVSINALASIIGVIIGGSVAGIPGMFLAIPLMAVLKVIFDHVPGWEAFGYVLSDDNPRFFNWSKIRLMYENKRRNQQS